MPPHLLYVANARIPGPRAHAIQIVRTCDALARAGVDVALWIPRRRGTGPAAPTAEQLRDFYGVCQPFPIRRLSSIDVIDTVPPPLQYLPFLLQSATFTLSVHRRMQAERFDRVFIRDPHTLFFLARLRPDVIPKIAFEAHGLPRSRHAQRRLAAALAKVGSVIALNARLAAEYATLGVPPERITAIAAAAAGGEPLPDRSQARRRLALGDDDRVACYTGTLTSDKGAGTLIDAARSLGAEWRVVLVGGDRRELAWARARANGCRRIVLPGRVLPREVPEFLAAADVLVVPNSAGNPATGLWASPMKLFEYYRANRPIVLSDVPALRMAVDELAPADRRFVWVVPDDARALARGIADAFQKRHVVEPVSDSDEDGWLRRAERLLEALKVRA